MKKIKNMYLKTNVLLIIFMLILCNFMLFISSVKASNIGEEVNSISLGESSQDLGVNNGYIEFKLTAKENIFDKVDDSIIYQVGDVVGIYNVFQDCELEINNLPIGIYNLEEIKTSEGLVVNTVPIELILSNQNNVIKVYLKDLLVDNKTILVEIYIIDEDSNEELIDVEFELSENNALPNNKDIYESVLKNIIINKKDSDTLNFIKKDFSFGLFRDIDCAKLAKTVNSNEDGTIIFDNLKAGKYYIKEIVAPEYYNLSDKVLKVEIKPDVQKGIIINGEVQDEENDTAKIDFINEIQKGKIKINKVDSEDNSIKLEGVEFEIFDKQGNFIERLVTDSSGIAVSSDLRCDTDYVLVETKTIEGYVFNNKQIEFRVNNEETKEIKIENEKIKKIQKVLPKTGF